MRMKISIICNQDDDINMFWLGWGDGSILLITLHEVLQTIFNLISQYNLRATAVLRK